MTKLEFMKELESLLSDIPLEEREEALQYYNGYFEDAGEEHEQEIIEELGSPAKVAAIIKESLNSNGADIEDDSYYTERGYQKSSDHDRKYQMVGSNKKSSNNGNSKNMNNGFNNSNGFYDQNDSNDTNSNYNTNDYYNNPNDNNTNRNYNNANGNYNNNNRSNSGQGQNYSYNTSDKAAKDYNRNTNIALVILVLIVGFPFFISIFSTIVGLIIGFGIAGVAMIICGIALFIAGLIKIAIPFVGMLLCGGGLLVLGLGMLFTLLSVVLFKNVLIGFVKWIINILRKPFENRSVTA